MKISNIRSELDAAATVHNNHSTLTPSANCFQPSSLGFFCNFELLSKDSVKKLVLSVPTKSCSLDPVPLKVVKECLDEIVPLLTVIINQSLQSGVFPDMWKEALVTPTLKKCGSDLAFKNFCPISNLQFVSKLVKRAAAVSYSPIWLRITCFLCSSQHIVLTIVLKQPYSKLKRTF